MKQYETKIFDLIHQQPYEYEGEVEVGPPVIEQLNGLGQEGWAVVHVFSWSYSMATVLMQRECRGSPYRD